MKKRKEKLKMNTKIKKEEKKLNGEIFISLHGRYLGMKAFSQRRKFENM